MPAPHDIDRLEAVRAVTANYTDFKGLYTALWGLFLMLVALLVRDGDLNSLILGALFVVNGLIDHRTLVRTLRPVAESETD